MSRLVSENKIMIKDCFNMLENYMSSESTKKGVIPFEKVVYTWRWSYDSVDLNALHERRGKHMGLNIQYSMLLHEVDYLSKGERKEISSGSVQIRITLRTFDQHMEERDTWS